VLGRAAIFGGESQRSSASSAIKQKTLQENIALKGVEKAALYLEF